LELSVNSRESKIFILFRSRALFFFFANLIQMTEKGKAWLRENKNLPTELFLPTLSCNKTRKRIALPLPGSPSSLPLLLAEEGAPFSPPSPGSEEAPSSGSSLPAPPPSLRFVSPAPSPSSPLVDFSRGVALESPSPILLSSPQVILGLGWRGGKATTGERREGGNTYEEGEEAEVEVTGGKPMDEEKGEEEVEEDSGEDVVFELERVPTEEMMEQDGDEGEGDGGRREEGEGGAG
jgi:hypothetical protein